MAAGSDGEPADRWMTLPNALCVLRMVGAVVLVGLAWTGREWAYLWLLIALLASDWLDGKLARLLNQRSRIGPRLDSFADGCMYAAMVVGLWWLRQEAVWEVRWFIFAVAVSYAVLVVAGMWRFGRLPTYHTRGAKTSWLLIGVGVIVLFADGPAWPFGLGLIAVVLTNVEALAISFVLRRYRDDVTSIFEAVRRRGEE